ncbi:MAG TPA: PIN domain-containing protein [Terriglobia bacterium]|nr:PIN domain-containing protein [Terriglobia bacterium]
MPADTHDINSYAFADSDRLVLDANVWLFLYGPTKPGDRRAAVYSAALARILAARCEVHADVLVLSEFINRFARLRYNLLQSVAAAPLDFKQFRNGADFKPVAKEIAGAVRRVLRTCRRTESGFASVDIASLIAEYEKGESDFNDQMLTELCRSQGFTFVTDDADFKGNGLKLVTANKKLLA